MNILQAASQTIEIQRLYANWEKQGLSEQEKRNRLTMYLDEKKRKINRMERNID